LPGIGREPYRSEYLKTRAIPKGTQYGSLAQLLEATQTSVRRLEGHVALPFSGANALSRVEHGRVVIVVVGADGVASVFGHRPDTAWFSRVDINEPASASVPVIIKYLLH
jgi:hypothetical protein